jgi:hypothetical protein
MKQEDIDLLIKDLSSRLPYGVKVQYEDKIFDIDYISPMYEEVKLNIADNYTIGVYEIKPYLFPLSSMTEEEVDEFTQFDVYGDGEYIIPNYETIDWLNAHHFDYRGLIEKGLAIDATNLNIY